MAALTKFESISVFNMSMLNMHSNCASATTDDKAMDIAPEKVKAIADFLKMTKSPLKVLDFSGIKFTIDHADGSSSWNMFLESLKKLTKVDTLNLSQINMTDEAVEDLVKQLTGSPVMHTLRSFTIKNNYLSYKGIAKTMEVAQNFTTLDLSDMIAANGYCLEAIADTLNKTNIKTLIISGIPASGFVEFGDSDRIGKKLSNAILTSNVEDLRMNNCNLEKDFWQLIKVALSSVGKRVEIQSNPLQPSDFDRFITHGNGPQHLYIDDNTQINTKGLMNIVTSYVDLNASFPFHLSARNVGLSDSDPYWPGLLTSLAQVKLKALDLSSNNGILGLSTLFKNSTYKNHLVDLRLNNFQKNNDENDDVLNIIRSLPLSIEKLSFDGVSTDLTGKRIGKALKHLISREGNRLRYLNLNYAHLDLNSVSELFNGLSESSSRVQELQFEGGIKEIQDMHIIKLARSILKQKTNENWCTTINNAKFSKNIHENLNKNFNRSKINLDFKRFMIERTESNGALQVLRFGDSEEKLSHSALDALCMAWTATRRIRNSNMLPNIQLSIGNYRCSNYFTHVETTSQMQAQEKTPS